MNMDLSSRFIYKNENLKCFLNKMYTYTKIGEGAEGFVLKSIINPNMVIKIGFKEEISQEFTNINLLPAKDFYYDRNLVTIEIVLIDEIDLLLSFSKYFKKECVKLLDDKKDCTMLKLNLPFIEGITFINIIRSTVPINFDRWLKMLLSLYELYIKIKNLNEEFLIYHNDLSEDNIIYNEDENKFYIIDFGQMSINFPDCCCGLDDMDSLLSKFIELINIGFEFIKSSLESLNLLECGEFKDELTMSNIESIIKLIVVNH